MKIEQKIVKTLIDDMSKVRDVIYNIDNKSQYLDCDIIHTALEGWIKLVKLLEVGDE